MEAYLSEVHSAGRRAALVEGLAPPPLCFLICVAEDSEWVRTKLAAHLQLLLGKANVAFPVEEYAKDGNDGHNIPDYCRLAFIIQESDYSVVVNPDKVCKTTFHLLLFENKRINVSLDSPEDSRCAIRFRSQENDYYPQFRKLCQEMKVMLRDDTFAIL